MPREHPLALHRLLPVGIVAALALVAFLALWGPGWFQRYYHPLEYADAIGETAKAAKLDPYLVAALINVESGFKAEDVSARGAVGLMQVMPSTAEEVARTHKIPERVNADTLKRPGTNLRIGTTHLADLVALYGKVDVALAAYNAGSGNVDDWLRASTASGKPFLESITFPQTQHYVEDVQAQRDIYAKLYPGAFSKAAAK